MPITFATMVIAACALAGISPLAGFWSKDEILLSTPWEERQRPGALLAAVRRLITVFLTAFYMFRMIFLTFGGEYGWRAGRACSSTSARRR